ncbi:hypothetical protein GCM10009808_11060 [Microbacterium sediminicola]|uniref:CobW C-terminal domain-containing protein n=1 Tax=Microbacterium sediminicola TaxID=415210 RepID=A0ABN2HYB8_9MICO
MDQVDVVAVVGSCASERLSYAKRLAAMSHRMLVPASRLAVSPDPIDEALALAPWADRPGGALIEFPGSVDMPEVIGSLAGASAPTRLMGVVCVVDATHLLDDLWRDTYMNRVNSPARDTARPEQVAEALLTAMQIEYASHIVLVNWSALSTPDLSMVMAVVGALAPRARVRLHRRVMEPWTAGEPYQVGQDAPGWVALLNGAFDPHLTDRRVSGFRYENVRPLHPGRLQTLLDERIEPGEFGRVIRSAGFCRFATRPHRAITWDHVGQMISYSPLSYDHLSTDDEALIAVGQELAFIGIDLDHDRLSAALDDVALTDGELLSGPQVWARFFDPFPAWPTAADRAE